MRNLENNKFFCSFIYFKINNFGYFSVKNLEELRETEKVNI